MIRLRRKARFILGAIALVWRFVMEPRHTRQLLRLARRAQRHTGRAGVRDPGLGAVLRQMGLFVGPDLYERRVERPAVALDQPDENNPSPQAEFLLSPRLLHMLAIALEGGDVEDSEAGEMFDLLRLIGAGVRQVEIFLGQRGAVQSFRGAAEKARHLGEQLKARTGLNGYYPCVPPSRSDESEITGANPLVCDSDGEEAS